MRGLSRTRVWREGRRYVCVPAASSEIAMARLFRFTRSTMSTMCRGVLYVGPLSSCWSTGVLTVRARGELYQCLHST